MATAASPDGLHCWALWSHGRGALPQPRRPGHPGHPSQPRSATWSTQTGSTTWTVTSCRAGTSCCLCSGSVLLRGCAGPVGRAGSCVPSQATSCSRPCPRWTLLTVCSEGRKGLAPGEWGAERHPGDHPCPDLGAPSWAGSWAGRGLCPPWRSAGHRQGAAWAAGRQHLELWMRLARSEAGGWGEPA